MSNWDALMWVGVVTAGAAVITVIVGVLAWLRPRSPKGPEAPVGAVHEQLWVEAVNRFPVFDQPDGSKEMGAHLVAVTAHNGASRPTKATSWGIALPGNKNITLMSPATTWEPSLPHWINPGDEASWYIKASDLRREVDRQGYKFDDMIAWVGFADGRRVEASKGVPLSSK